MYTCSTVFTPFYTKHLKIKLLKKINYTILQITGIDTLWVCKKVIIFMEVYKEKMWHLISMFMSHLLTHVLVNILDNKRT